MFFSLLTVVFGGLGVDDPLLVLGPLQWSRPSLVTSTFFASRLLVVGALVVGVTVAIGYNRLFSWLHRVGTRWKPFGHDLTPLLFTMGLALRFLPVLQEEAHQLRLGWDARGAALMGRGPVGFVRRTSALVIPLVAATLRRADNLADGLQLRGGFSPSGASMTVDDHDEDAGEKDKNVK